MPKIFFTMNHTAPYMPAEWQEQRCVQLTWPHEGTDWLPYIAETTRLYSELTSAIAAHEPVIIAAKHPDEVRKLLKGKLDDASMSRVSVYECDCNDTWARDHAFISLKESGRLRLLDFRFNGWGDKFPWQKDNQINRRMLSLGAIEGDYEAHDDFVLEGGSIESDGRGTILTTSNCLLAPHRNQPLTKAEIELRLKEYLHADRILWLSYGHLIGDDTDGHIDTLVRMAPDDTLLYVKCSDESDPQYADLRLMEEQLKTFRTIDGRPYRLIPLPMAREITSGGERLPATYANFLIINGAVIVPTYGQDDRDDEACKRIAEALKGREIIPIDARTLIRQHGSIHCITMQYPK